MTSTRQNISVGYFVLPVPGYAQDTADASHVECIEPSLLSGTCSSCLAAIVDRYLYIHRQFGACPHSRRETSESWSYFPNPLVDLCVQGEVVSDSGAEVGELADRIYFEVVDGNGGGVSVSCPRTFVVFRLMVSPKFLQACEKQSINDWSPSWVWVVTAAS